MSYSEESPVFSTLLPGNDWWAEVAGSASHSEKRSLYTAKQQFNWFRKNKEMFLFVLHSRTDTHTHTHLPITPCFKLYLNNSRLLEKTSLHSPLQSLNLIQFFTVRENVISTSEKYACTYSQFYWIPSSLWLPLLRACIAARLPSSGNPPPPKWNTKTWEAEMCGACIRSLHPLLHIITRELEWKRINCKKSGTLLRLPNTWNALPSVKQ